MNEDGPLVSIVTPVYNGEKYLAECIESVLAQTYPHWDYTIVNNCSTDGSLEIAESYGRRDSRIRVITNEKFVGAAENYNICFTQISPQSKYCKVVSADDWITDDCVEKLVAIAERHPSVGIVGCYQQSAETVLWKGIPLDVTVVNGREIARKALLVNGLHVLGSSTSLLIRADIVRAKVPFYPHTRPHADTDACYEILVNHDLGFAHEVLCFDRVHSGRWTTAGISLGAGLPAYIEAVIKYGKTFLTPEEQLKRLCELDLTYHGILGRSLLKMRGLEYWKFHLNESRSFGFRIRFARVLSSAIGTAIRGLCKPRASLGKCYRYLCARLGDCF